MEKERQTVLSARLAAIAAMVEEGSYLADIGTDHGYLPIRLLEEGRIPRAIAMDINQGPLLRARAHVEERGLSDKVELRPSDGFSALLPGEADAAVIAGMGGPLTIRILKEGAEAVRRLKYLVLSPQSDIPSVRRYLLEQGFDISAEDMVLDGGKYYIIMKVLPFPPDGEKEKEERHWDLLEETYGRHLLRSGKPVVLDFLRKEKYTYETVKRQLLPAETDRAGKRLSQVERRLETVEAAIAMAEKTGRKLKIR